MRTSRFVTSAVLATALLAGAGASPAPAQSSRATSEQRQAAVVGATIGDQEARAALEFWTPERMAAAQPALQPRPRVPAEFVGAPERSEPRGPRVVVQPGVEVGSEVIGSPAPRPVPLDEQDPDDPTGGGDPKPKPPLPAPPEPVSPLDIPKMKTVGKVFASIGDTAFMVYCSASVINSPNKSVVWTAGHCLSGGDGSQWYKNMVFVPGYGLDGPGSRPFGTFPAIRIEAYSDFYFNGNVHYDIGGFVVGRNLDGQRLQSAVGGGNGLAVEIPRDSYYEARGYPGTVQSEQKSCEGFPSSEYVDADGGWNEPYMIELGCGDFAGGASGGPWFVDMTCDAQCPVDGWGWVASVVSQGAYYGDIHVSNYGPYQNGLAWVLYDMLSGHPVP